MASSEMSTVLARMPVELREHLEAAARAADRSLSAEVVRRLQRSVELEKQANQEDASLNEKVNTLAKGMETLQRRVEEIVKARRREAKTKGE